MAWYKVANGPLTIANSPINVTIEIAAQPSRGGESDSTEVVECSASDWIDNSYNMVESGNAYRLRKQDSLGNYFYVYVLDDATLNSGWLVSQGADVPMTGIFVSENVRGIATQASTEYKNKISAEYLDLTPVTISATANDYTVTNVISVSMTSGETMSLPIYLEPGHITPLEIDSNFMSGDGISSISDNGDGSIYIAIAPESTGTDIYLIIAEDNEFSCGGMLVVNVGGGPK